MENSTNFFFEPFPKVSEEFFRVASQLIICFGKGLLFYYFGEIIRTQRGQAWEKFLALLVTNFKKFFSSANPTREYHEYD